MKKNVLALSIAAMIGGLGFAGRREEDVIYANEFLGDLWTSYAGLYVPPQPTHSAYMEVFHQGDHNV